jgi:hypothetical protein
VYNRAPMIARCAKCQNTFSTDRFGAQFCPHCGAEIFLRDPNAAEPAAANPAPGVPAASGTTPGGAPPATGSSEAASGDRPAPWEEPGSHGIVGAFIETLRLSMLEPSKFFAGLRREPAGGAYTFGLLIWIFSSIVGTLWDAATRSAANYDEVLNWLPNGKDLIKSLNALESTRNKWIEILTSPVQGVVLFFVIVAVLHLSVMIFASGGKGWNATVRAFAYASGPLLLSIIPFCGGFIGWIWSMVLTIIAVIQLHKTTGGRAAAAVLVPIALLLCCGCLMGIVFAASLGALLGSR